MDLTGHLIAKYFFGVRLCSDGFGGRVQNTRIQRKGAELEKAQREKPDHDGTESFLFVLSYFGAWRDGAEAAEALYLLLIHGGEN